MLELSGSWARCDVVNAVDSERVPITFEADPLPGTNASATTLTYSGVTNCTGESTSDFVNGFTFAASGTKSASWDAAGGGAPAGLSDPITVSKVTITDPSGGTELAVAVIDTSGVSPLWYMKTDSDSGSVDSEGFPVEITANGVLTRSLPLFDDFATGTIDLATKWTLAELTFGTAEPCNQSAATNALVASQDYLGAGSGDCGLELAGSGAVVSYSAEVTVTAFVENSGPIRARLRGIFYNDGSGGGGDLAGDVFAQIFSKGTVVEASVVKCTAAACSTSVVLMPTTQLGTITFGSAHILFLGWDEASTFTFQLDFLPPLVFDASAFAPFNGPATGAGGLPGGGTTDGSLAGSKVVELRGGSGDVDGSITATFDNIRCATTGGGAC